MEQTFLNFQQHNDQHAASISQRSASEAARAENDWQEQYPHVHPSGQINVQSLYSRQVQQTSKQQVMQGTHSRSDVFPGACTQRIGTLSTSTPRLGTPMTSTLTIGTPRTSTTMMGTPMIGTLFNFTPGISTPGCSTLQQHPSAATIGQVSNQQRQQNPQINQNWVNDDRDDQIPVQIEKDVDQWFLTPSEENDQSRQSRQPISEGDQQRMNNQRPIDQPIYFPINQTTNGPIDQSTNQPINPSSFSRQNQLANQMPNNLNNSMLQPLIIQNYALTQPGDQERWTETPCAQHTSTLDQIGQLNSEGSNQVQRWYHMQSEFQNQHIFSMRNAALDQGPLSQHQGLISLYQGPVSQYQGPIGQYQGPISQYQGTVSQAQAPLMQYVAPITLFQEPIIQQSESSTQAQWHSLQDQGPSTQHQGPITQRQGPTTQGKYPSSIGYRPGMLKRVYNLIESQPECKRSLWTRDNSGRHSLTPLALSIGELLPTWQSAVEVKMKMEELNDKINGKQGRGAVEQQSTQNNYKRETSQSKVDALRATLKCPITMDVMRDPVVAGDGHTYERKAIKTWFKKRRVSPMTNLPIDTKNLISNRVVKAQIQELEGGQIDLTQDDVSQQNSC